MTYRFAIVVSHPIQHFGAFYRGLAAHPKIDLTVVFASSIGAKPYFDKDMNTEIKWQTDLLGGYRHAFLEEADRIRRASPLTLNNPSVGRELARIAPEVVLLHGYNHITSMRSLWWCRRNRVPAMLIADSELRTQRSVLVRAAKSSLIPLLYRQFSAFLTVGDFSEEHYRHYGVPDEKMFRSPFTIDEATYRAARRDRAKLRAELRTSLGIAETDVVCLTVGKVNGRKRSRDIVDAARLVKAAQGTMAPIRFMLGGNGTDLEALKAAAAAEGLAVHFLGFVNVDQLPKTYAAADMIVHPSGRDPHPLVMSEAACMGLPLVVSDRVGAVGPTDVAREGENTIVFPCGDVAALSRAVMQLVADPEARARMSAKSIAFFDELDITRSVEGAIAAIEHCLSAKPAAVGQPVAA